MLDYTSYHWWQLKSNFLIFENDNDGELDSIVAQKTSKILEILYVPQLVEKQISFFQVSIPARKN